MRRKGDAEVNRFVPGVPFNSGDVGLSEPYRVCTAIGLATYSTIRAWGSTTASL